MDDSAALHFGDLAVRESDLFGVDAEGFGAPVKGAFEGDAVAAPEFAGGVVPDDLVFVVVAVQAERDTERLLIGVVEPVASEVCPVWTEFGFAARPAGERFPDLAVRRVWTGPKPGR